MFRLEEAYEEDPEEERLRALKQAEQRAAHERQQAAQVRQAAQAVDEKAAAEAGEDELCYGRASPLQRELNSKLRQEELSQVRYRVHSEPDESHGRATSSSMPGSGQRSAGTPSPKTAPGAASRARNCGAGKAREWFQPFHHEQQSVLHKIELAAGVSMVDVNSGQGKVSAKTPIRRSGQMTRQEYISGSAPPAFEEPVSRPESLSSTVSSMALTGELSAGGSLASLGNGRITANPHPPASPAAKVQQQFQALGPHHPAGARSRKGSTSAKAVPGSHSMVSAAQASSARYLWPKDERLGGTIVANRELLRSLFA
eukprot:TRINITY_DN30483_c0_g1_i1.p1 TRINITY_DN30483_c0_g1~~TRINITY_DN30483_c0_g1_i1.p1  ORF type:complete len:314 (-),score=64.32 TRINITY_DN30483_c0_g1_i1:23-964(-)